MGRVSPCSSNASIATAMLTTSFSRRLGATAFLCRSIYTYRKGTILTSATLEPQAISESSNHNMNRAASTNFPPPAYDAAKSAAIDAIVDASEIEVDPLTHLPFLKNVHFNDFNISDGLKKRLSTAGFKTPTPVQAKAIPPALQGADILATAATGTGKTLSFLVPMIELMDANPLPVVKGKRGPIRALILLPTRELAMQVLEHYSKLVPSAKNDAVLVVGGLSENTQLDQLSRGPRLVVATPGRLEDFLRRRAALLQNMIAVHQHFRFDDGNKSGFLAQRGIARQRMCVGFDATPAGNVVADGNHRPPLGKTRSHLKVFRQTVAQSVQTFGYFFAGMRGKILGSGIHFDAGNNSRID